MVLSIRQQVLPGGLLSYLAIAGSTALGFIALLAYARFIREADELQRKIQLQALALGFGGGFLATFVFELLGQAQVPSIEVGDLSAVMAVFYLVGFFLGARRYA